MPRKRRPIEYTTIIITNWEKYNPEIRQNGSHKRPRFWFRLERNLFLNNKIGHLNASEFKLFIYLLSDACGANNCQIDVSWKLIASILHMKESILIECAFKLHELQLVTVMAHGPKVFEQLPRIEKKRREKKIHPLPPEGEKQESGVYVCNKYNQEAGSQREGNSTPITADLGLSVRLAESPPQIATHPPLPPIDGAALQECLEAWKLSMLRHGIKKDPRLDEVAIVRLIQAHGSQKTLLALVGIRYEAATKDYDPKKNFHIRRLNKADNFEKFVNLASIQRKEKAHDRTNEEVLGDLRRKPSAPVGIFNESPQGSVSGVVAKDESLSWGDETT